MRERLLRWLVGGRDADAVSGDLLEAGEGGWQYWGQMLSCMRVRLSRTGVRMALGAAPGDVRWMVLVHGLRITAVGVAIGLVLSAATVRLLRAYLHGLSPFDPVAFGGACLAWTAIAMLASWIPSRRATRVDPLTALKWD